MAAKRIASREWAEGARVMNSWMKLTFISFFPTTSAIVEHKALKSGDSKNSAHSTGYLFTFFKNFDMSSYCFNDRSSNTRSSIVFCVLKSSACNLLRPFSSTYAACEQNSSIKSVRLNSLILQVGRDIYGKLIKEMGAVFHQRCSCCLYIRIYDILLYPNNTCMTNNMRCMNLPRPAIKAQRHSQHSWFHFVLFACFLLFAFLFSSSSHFIAAAHSLCLFWDYIL